MRYIWSHYPIDPIIRDPIKRHPLYLLRVLNLGNGMCHLNLVQVQSVFGGEVDVADVAGLPAWLLGLFQVVDVAVAIDQWPQGVGLGAEGAAGKIGKHKLRSGGLEFRQMKGDKITLVKPSLLLSYFIFQTENKHFNIVGQKDKYWKMRLLVERLSVVLPSNWLRTVTMR
jgi:hypothetical protein